MSSSRLLLLLCLAACTKGDDDGFGDPPQGDDSAPAISPVVTLLTPLEGERFGYDQLVHLSGTVEDDSAPSELAVVVWVNGAVHNGATLAWSGNAFSADVALAVGAQTLEVRATDPDGNGGSAAVNIEVIADQPPTSPVVAIEPSEPVTGDALFVGLVELSTDPEGLPVTYDYRWWTDGVEQPQLAGLASVPAGNTRFGQSWTVQVVASDGVLHAEPAEASTQIGPVGPTVSVSITPEAPLASDTVQCLYTVEEPDGQPLTDGSATWFVNGADAGDADLPLSGAFVRGDTVTCEVSATSTRTATGRAEVTVQNAPPELETPTLSGAPTTELGTLSCTANAWDPDGDPLTLRFDWWVNGQLVATGETLDGALFDRDDEVWCEAGADDGVDTSPTLASEHTVILNSAPVAGVVAIGPALAIPGTTVVCTEDVAATDADPLDTLSATVRWLVNGVERSAGTDWSFDTAGLAVGDEVRCAVDTTDGADTATAEAALTLGSRLSGALSTNDADISLSGTSARAFFGVTIEALGDLDGDGLAELAIAGTGYGSDAGAVTVWSGADLVSGATADVDATWMFGGPAAGAMLGDAHGLAAAGDIDGDGRPELLVGADRASIAGVEDGAAYLLLSGQSASWPATDTIDAVAALTIRGDSSRDRLGSAMAATDLDGDGVADLLVGAGLNDASFTSAGQVALFFDPAALSGTLAASDADVVWTGAGQSDRLGLNAVTALGDTDGDGYPEVALGAPMVDGSLANDAGAVYLVSATSLLSGSVAAGAQARIDGFDVDDDFGISVVALGDLDQDGLADFAVGGRFADVSGADAGGVYVWFGGAMSGVSSVLASDACWGSTTNGDRLGYEMSAGDMDGDGLAELSMGTYSRPDGANANAGAAWLMSGAGATGWPIGGPVDSLAQTWVIGSAGSYLGRDPTVLGDINGDGYGEWVVGAQSETRGGLTRAGGVYLFFGP